MRIAKVNLNYTIYYPLTEKYISIYAEKKKKKDKDAGQDQDVEEEGQTQGEDSLSASTTTETQAMWRTIEKCMQDGTLDLLREGQLGLNGEEKAATEAETPGSRSKKAGGKEKANVKTSKTESRKVGSTKRGPPAPTGEDEGNESDGGFFEM